MSAEIVHRRREQAGKAPGMRIALPPRLRRLLMVGLAVVAGLVALGVLANWAYRWRTFTAAEAGFTIDFPGRPSVQKQTVGTPAGMVTAFDYRVVNLLHGATYEAGLGDYPDAVAAQVGTDSLDNACTGIVRKMGGTLVAQQNVTLGDFAGRDLRVTVPGLGIVRLRILLCGTRNYMLMVSPMPWWDGEARVNRFFNSLTLRK